MRGTHFLESIEEGTSQVRNRKDVSKEDSLSRKYRGRGQVRAEKKSE